jgi:hypothetical protein
VSPPSCPVVSSFFQDHGRSVAPHTANFGSGLRGLPNVHSLAPYPRNAGGLRAHRGPANAFRMERGIRASQPQRRCAALSHHCRRAAASKSKMTGGAIVRPARHCLAPVDAARESTRGLHRCVGSGVGHRTGVCSGAGGGVRRSSATPPGNDRLRSTRPQDGPRFLHVSPDHFSIPRVSAG